MDILNIELIKKVEQEIGAMNERLKLFKGDKTEFQKRISVFKELLKEYKKTNIDVFIKDADISTMQSHVLLKINDLDIRENQLNQRQDWINEWGGELTEEQLQEIAKIMQNENT